MECFNNNYNGCGCNNSFFLIILIIIILIFGLGNWNN